MCKIYIHSLENKIPEELEKEITSFFIDGVSNVLNLPRKPTLHVTKNTQGKNWYDKTTLCYSRCYESNDVESKHLAFHVYIFNEPIERNDYRRIEIGLAHNKARADLFNDRCIYCTTVCKVTT